MNTKNNYLDTFKKYNKKTKFNNYFGLLKNIYE